MIISLVNNSLILKITVYVLQNQQMIRITCSFKICGNISFRAFLSNISWVIWDNGGFTLALWYIIYSDIDFVEKISDEALWELVDKCNVATLQRLLRLAGVPYSNIRKEKLQLRLFHSIKLGLQPKESPEEWARSRSRSMQQKLVFNSITIMHPLLLSGWRSNQFPPITKYDVVEYFNRSKSLFHACLYRL